MKTILILTFIGSVLISNAQEWFYYEGNELINELDENAWTIKTFRPNFEVEVEAGKIVDDKSGAVIKVVDMLGRTSITVSNSDTERIDLASGVYAVSVGGIVEKVIVR